MIDPFAITVEGLHQPRFGTLVRSYRGRRRLSLRGAAAESGVPHATWARAEAGRDVLLSAAVRIAEWMRHQPEADDV